MKKSYIKFSDERNKKYSIKTIIWENKGERKVTKTNIFPEGRDHILQIYNNANILSQNFKTDICRCTLDNESIEFDYINGISLESMYLNALRNNDRDKFIEILHLHKSIILGKEENIFMFKKSESFSEIFGDSQVFEGKKALKCSNFDAIASNIIFQNERPVFIDYEWVYTFPVPVDLVIFHCIYDMYIHNELMNNFVTLREAMNVLKVETDISTLKNAYSNFYKFVTSEKDGSNYALVKAICLKNEKTIQEFDHEYLVWRCEADRLQTVIDSKIKDEKKLNEKNALLNSQLYDEQVENMKLKFELNNLKNEFEKANNELKKANNELESFQRSIIGKMFCVLKQRENKDE